MIEVSSYVTSLFAPRPVQQKSARRVWGMSLQDVVLPSLMASNVTGHTAIPHDALGAPVRLAYDKDGSVKFNKTGKPVTKVAKPINDAVNLWRENMIAHLNSFTADVIKSHKAEYAREVAACSKAGKPIIEADERNLKTSLAARQAAEMAAQIDAITEPEAEPETAAAAA